MAAGSPPHVSVSDVIASRSAGWRLCTRYLTRIAHARIEDIPQPIPEQVQREDNEHDGNARECRDPPGITNKAPRTTEHRPPFRRRRLGAEPEVTQAGCGKNRPGDTDRCQNDKR